MRKTFLALSSGLILFPLLLQSGDAFGQADHGSKGGYMRRGTEAARVLGPNYTRTFRREDYYVTATQNERYLKEEERKLVARFKLSVRLKECEASGNNCVAGALVGHFGNVKFCNLETDCRAADPNEYLYVPRAEAPSLARLDQAGQEAMAWAYFVSHWLYTTCSMTVTVGTDGQTNAEVESDSCKEGIQIRNLKRWNELMDSRSQKLEESLLRQITQEEFVGTDLEGKPCSVQITGLTGARYQFSNWDAHMAGAIELKFKTDFVGRWDVGTFSGRPDWQPAPPGSSQQLHSSVTNRDLGVLAVYGSQIDPSKIVTTLVLGADFRPKVLVIEEAQLWTRYEEKTYTCVFPPKAAE